MRLQSDERLITLVRRGNLSAFEALVARYHARLLAFCRHLLGSREDAEDVLQEVMTAAFNAMIADDRPINVRPWLYRIARNRCLNHLRRVHAVGVDSMDIHLSDGGETTADKVHKAEEFRLLVHDIQALPETQRTALVLREMDALSYEQISEAMETTVPSVKSLLVRARVSLAEAAEARQLSCEQVRMELAEVAEGLLAKATPPVRRHLRTCQRCASFQTELKRTSRALAALLPLGPLALLKTLALAHLGHSAGAGSSASAGTSAGAAVSSGAAVGSGAAAGGALVGAGGMMPLGLGAVGVKAAAGLAAAALVTAGAVDLSHTPRVAQHHPAHPAVAQTLAPSTLAAAPSPSPVTRHLVRVVTQPRVHRHPAAVSHPASSSTTAPSAPVKLTQPPPKKDKTTATAVTHKSDQKTGTSQSESVTTVLSSGSSGSSSGSGSSTSTPATDGSPTPTSSTPSSSTQPGSGTPSSGSGTPSSGSGTPSSGSGGVPLGDSTPPPGPGTGSTPPPSGPTGDPAPAPGPTGDTTPTSPPVTPSASAPPA